MKTEEIKILLESFYNGETSVDEERLLLRYFESGNVTQELLEDKSIFIELYNSQPINVPADLEMKLDNFIDELEEKDKRKQVSHSTAKRVRIVLASVAAIAACLLLIFIVANKYGESTNGTNINITECNEQTGTDGLRDTYTNPQDAQRAATEALMKVSVNLNKGFGELSFAASNLERNTDKIQKRRSKTN